MGPSGSGKTSLLNVLAGRSSSMGDIKINGKISVAGQEINPVSFRKNIAYVMQDDALMPTSTPREALTFSASLRLPSETTDEAIDLLVNELLENLGIKECADVMIGGEMIKGVSGGQRKRTSVGVELITNPALLFLDEPSSGLDSFSAYNCIKLLKTVAHNNNSVVLCTIHQPSSEVFFLFDQVIFMKEGRIFYQGKVDNLVKHFSGLGFSCPDNYNPSDYIMFINQNESSKDLESKGLFMIEPPNRKLSESDIDVSSKKEEIEYIIPATSSFWKQLKWLSYREALNTKRDIGAIIGRFGVTSFLSLLFGMIFLGSGNKDDANPTNFSSHFGSMTMVTISSMFGAAQPIMLTFPFERPMFLREYSTGTYSVLPYFISKFTLELPVTLLQSLVQFLFVYYMIEMRGNFFYIVGASWLLGMASSSVALCLGAAVGNVKSVTELSPLLFVPQLLFAGFFIRTSQIPVFLRWAQYLCGIKYSINLLILTEFDSDLESCQGGAAPFCKNIKIDNDVEEDLWWVYLVCLLALFIGFRIIASLILMKKAKSFS
jgi:ABC-type multidrug transport system ATPase subunit